MKLVVYFLNAVLLIGLISHHFIRKITAQEAENKGVAEVYFGEMQPKKAKLSKSIYDYSFVNLDGDTVALSVYKGKKILFVNTASECGYTPQYKQLEEIYKKYGERLVVIGFPTNDFGKQEPGSNEEISSFCEKNYGVTFPMSQKITVKGDEMHPVYQWLTKRSLNNKEDSEVKWNFQKYLVDEKGKLLTIYYSATKPDDTKVIEKIKK
jgi:glutathione peroxidase